MTFLFNDTRNMLKNTNKIALYSFTNFRWWQPSFHLGVFIFSHSYIQVTHQEVGETYQNRLKANSVKKQHDSLISNASRTRDALTYQCPWLSLRTTILDRNRHLDNFPFYTFFLEIPMEYNICTKKHKYLFVWD